MRAARFLSVVLSACVCVCVALGRAQRCSGGQAQRAGFLFFRFSASWPNTTEEPQKARQH